MKTIKGTKSKNKKELMSFAEYALDHPEQRFWQALRNWSGYANIIASDKVIDWDKKVKGVVDTFYIE